MIFVRIQAKPVDFLITQVYAPTEEDEESVKDNFYANLEKVIKESKKAFDQLVVLGDFNAKVGDDREPGIIGPFGLGDRNNNGERLVDFCREQNLFAANTWFEQKKFHTWTAPNGITENQIDFILVSRRFRNSVQNAKVRFDADCGSDHNPVVAKILTKLKYIRKKEKKRS